MTTPQELLDNKPSNEEVERMDQMWAMMDSTTQFLNALLQVLKSRELDNEHAALEKFVAEMARVEANDLNALCAAQAPITQRAVPK